MNGYEIAELFIKVAIVDGISAKKWRNRSGQAGGGPSRRRRCSAKG